MAESENEEIMLDNYDYGQLGKYLHNYYETISDYILNNIFKASTSLSKTQHLWKQINHLKNWKKPL